MQRAHLCELLKPPNEIIALSRFLPSILILPSLGKTCQVYCRITIVLIVGLISMSQTERLHWIHAEISAGHFPNAARVAAQFEVTQRTAYTDRNYLRDRLNAPLATDRQRGGWYYTEPTYLLPFLALTETESTTLRRTLLAAQEYLTEADAQIVELLFHRLNPHLPDTRMESLSGAVHLAPARQGDPVLLASVRTCIRDRQKLWIRYHSLHRDAVRERIVHPYHLHYFRGEPHLIAWCEDRQEVRQFFLGRVQEWQERDGDCAFVQNPEFDLEAYLRQGLEAQHGEKPISLRVRFSPYQARWARERTYHPSQRLEELAGGGLILTLQVAGRAEIRRWLQTFGAEVEVLEPEELRAEIREEAKKLAKLYDATPD